MQPPKAVFVKIGKYSKFERRSAKDTELQKEKKEMPAEMPV